MERISENDIAVIGMAGRFPKANNIAEYWQNLVNGVNSIEKADEERIQASGIPQEILQHKRFVNASSRLSDARYFDADFFGLSNTEVMHMDPQIRLLLQTSWHAIEDAGYDVSRLDVAVGNFCGMSTNHYLLNVLNSNSPTAHVDPLLYRILNEKDFLATWISYKLNLTGPAMSVQTACSTSLLAIHLACQSLLNRECEMALAGGVSYSTDNKIGYIHVPESIYSKDGLCRPFDKDASGTVDGYGVGAVILKRAVDALNDKDHIYALIKGTAVNNDGANKQGYTTPSVNTQRDVILEALAVADVDPTSIGMIEAHGTGTLIGDPIEVTALTEAFRAYTDRQQYCAIGSVKSNIGHLDAAAGIASFIKAVLCVYNAAFVPSINFSAPNPVLQLETSPFYVSQSHQAWPEHFNIRRAGVSSLGVGGTNVHLVIEQAPALARVELPEQPRVVALSAMNPRNLHLQKKQLAEHIRSTPGIRLEDIEFTTIYGRKEMSYRYSLVCSNKDELVARLLGEQEERSFEGAGTASETVFLFPGQGSQYPGMAKALYDRYDAFREDMDHCFSFLQSAYSFDLKTILFGEDSSLLDRTEYTQVALFVVEYCLANALQRWGVKPAALIGHSLGEYVVACIVDCLTLDDALKLVYHRGRLMGMMPSGAMALVRTTQEELSPLLLNNISVCAVNAPDSIVVGGTIEDIQQQCILLSANKIEYIKLKVSHAYHTPMMNNALAAYEKILSEVEFKPFNAPIFSTYTGGLVSAELFCTKQYWLDQIIHPVQFLDAAQQAAEYTSNPTFIEVGPGNGLSSFIRAIFKQQAGTVNLLPKTATAADAITKFCQAKARLYAEGVTFEWPAVHDGRRVSLPGYVFSKNYFWKPSLHVQHKTFSEIKHSYHHTNERYSCGSLRTFVELPLDSKQQLSEEVLGRLSDLHTQYLDDIRALFPAGADNIYNRIEALYDDTSLNSREDDLPDAKDTHKTRTVSSAFVAPATATAQRIAAHWGDILGYYPVGALDNYFEVGGNSLLATKLMTRLSDEFDMPLSFKELSECLTIQELAALVESKKKMMELVGNIAIENSNADNYLEL
ncbi:type I polyketide synthase [uncultured Chitinophaga sp.]|jgi:Polyketide synthase modules and related proteins|uniref:type I polyketide synthase n=1 Tax=uncultured Chitinophaga sp. TaxID=339340 RepID=UPI002603DE6A|nr:type I polyketide synthase [uncultured Chitinophaga sp.]